MARALEQILAELDSVYTPQKDVYNQQIKALPGQQQAELGGLEAAKTDSFNQITTGANRRGVAFGGIPLAEQASYLGQSYLPAVANLKGRFQGQKSDLQLRLAELAAKQRQDAYGIRDYELQQDARAAEAARARAAASSGGGGSTGFNFADPYGTGQDGGQGPTISAADQQLYNQMFVRGDGQGYWDTNSLVSDYNATLDSARRGNAADQRKIQFYHTYKPEIFGSQYPSFKRDNTAAAKTASNALKSTGISTNLKGPLSSGYVPVNSNPFGF